MVFALAAGAALLLLFAWRLVAVYRGLRGLNAAIDAAFALLRASLRQRHHELPRLLGACRRHLGADNERVLRVLRARAAVDAASGDGDVVALGAAERGLRAALRELYELVDTQPELCTDPEFVRLRARIAALDRAIWDDGEVYNDRASVNNIRIRIAPLGPIVGRCGFHVAPLLELPSDRIPP